MKLVLSAFWREYSPSVISGATITAVWTLNHWNLVVAIVAGIGGILWVYSKLFWGWWKWFKGKDPSESE